MSGPGAGGAKPAVLFRYSPDRKGEHPLAHLRSFSGVLHADGYAGFDQLYRPGKISEAACWAHVRRKFFDIHAANASPIAAEALERIGALYALEADIRGQAPEQRCAQRQARAGPLLDQLHAWLLATPGQALEEVGARRCDPLCAHAMERAHSISRRRTHRDRQQRRRACAARGGLRAKELPVRWGRYWRRAGRGDLQSDRDREAQRPGSASVPALRLRAHRRASDQSHRRTSALERRRGRACRTACRIVHTFRQDGAHRTVTLGGGPLGVLGMGSTLDWPTDDQREHVERSEQEIAFGASSFVARGQDGAGIVAFVGLSNQGAMYRVLNHSMTHISLWKHCGSAVIAETGFAVNK